MGGWLHALLVQEGVSFVGGAPAPVSGPFRVDTVGSGNGVSASAAIEGTVDNANTFDLLDLYDLAFSSNSPVFSVLATDDLGGGEMFLSGGGVTFNWDAAGTLTLACAGNLQVNSAKLGLFGIGAGTAKATVTGAKLPSDTVMASLLTALSGYGLITNATT